MIAAAASPGHLTGITPIRRVVYGDPGYADALRALIPREVVATSEKTGSGLRVQFDDGEIVLHPRFDELTGPEIALLNGFDDREWMCWRPGEHSFEDLS